MRSLVIIYRFVPPIKHDNGSNKNHRALKRQTGSTHVNSSCFRRHGRAPNLCKGRQYVTTHHFYCILIFPSRCVHPEQNFAPKNNAKATATKVMSEAHPVASCLCPGCALSLCPVLLLFAVWVCILQKIVDGVSSDTEVYFCGGGGINALLRKACAARGMKYVGSSVQ